MLMAILELGSIYLVRHGSVTYERVSRQYTEALKIRPAPPGEPPSVLMVGNSLFLYGVDLDQFHRLTSGGVRIHPIFMEGTGYYDWLYGLRRLFRHGSRPQVVVLGLEAYSALADGVWDETPMLLFDTQDALAAASAMKLDRTETTDLLLSHWSAFWGMRGLFRRRMISHLIPGYENLVPFIRPGDFTFPERPAFRAKVEARLRNLRDLCQTHGARMILVIPPTLSSESAVKQMAAAALNTGVQAIVPIDPASLGESFYEADNIHLNPRGAVRFTSALAADLPQVLLPATCHPL